MSLVAGRQQQQQRRRRPGDFCLLEPERKRVCRSSETVPQMIRTSHPPSKWAVDDSSMELDLKQNNPTVFFNPQIMKEKPNYMIFPDNETRTPVQPCPRCIAGEPIIHSVSVMESRACEKAPRYADAVPVSLGGPC